MRRSYQFNEKSDPKGKEWGRDAPSLLWEFVHYKTIPYQGYSTSRGIEEQISILTKAIGGLAEVLISKGRMSPQEFINAIEADDTFEVRENKQL